jgi:hypothetical protein
MATKTSSDTKNWGARHYCATRRARWSALLLSKIREYDGVERNPEMPSTPNLCPSCAKSSGVSRKKIGGHFFYFCKAHPGVNLGPVAQPKPERLRTGRHLRAAASVRPQKRPRQNARRKTKGTRRHLGVAAWRTYEEVAAFLLDKFGHEFGLKTVEGKQLIDGLRSGTPWEIEGKGIREGDSGFVIIECRRYTTSRQNQEKTGALAYRITDTGAAGGIVVSPLGLQEGAKKVAAAEKILEVHLDKNSTAFDYVLSFLNRVMVGLTDDLSVCLRESGQIEVRDRDGNIITRRQF